MACYRDSFAFFVIASLTDSTLLSPSREAASRSAPQEFLKISWNPEVHHWVHKSPPPVPILNQMNAVHTISSYLYKMNFNILPPTLLSSHQNTFLFPMRATFPAHLILLYLIIHNVSVCLRSSSIPNSKCIMSYHRQTMLLCYILERNPEQ
jgi:hypothetical protein